MNPARHQKICAEIQEKHAAAIAALTAENARLREELAGAVQTIATHANQLSNYAGNLDAMLGRRPG